MKRYAANLDTTQWKTERRYAYDGVNVVADSGRADSSWTWHVFQGYNRLALADKSGSTLRVKYLLNDHLGTANVMVDDTGRVLAKYARDPWGNLESSWESTPLRWQFTGKEQDPEVGGNVFYFNARFYDAERGSFIGRDPKLQFWTPYSYVGNGPLTGIDPTGEQDYSVMTGMDFGGMADFTFGQSTGSSGNQIALKVNSVFVEFASSAPEWPGKGASYTAYGAFGLQTGAMLSYGFGNVPLAAALQAGAIKLGTASAVLGAGQTVIHVSQAYMKPNDPALSATAIKDLVCTLSGPVFSKVGGGILGVGGKLTDSERQYFFNWGATGAGAIQSGVSDAIEYQQNYTGLPQWRVSPAARDAVSVARNQGR